MTVCRVVQSMRSTVLESVFTENMVPPGRGAACLQGLNSGKWATLSAVARSNTDRPGVGAAVIQIRNLPSELKRGRLSGWRGRSNPWRNTGRALAMSHTTAPPFA